MNVAKRVTYRYRRTEGSHQLHEIWHANRTFAAFTIPRDVLTFFPIYSLGKLKGALSCVAEFQNVLSVSGLLMLHVSENIIPPRCVYTVYCVVALVCDTDFKRVKWPYTQP